jgi:ABC-2 type transport system permease protein
MLRNIMLKTLRDQRRGLAWWGLGIALLVAYIMVVYPTIRDNTQYDQLLQAYPEQLKELLLAGTESFTSPSGYLNGALFAMLVPLMFLIFTTGRGANAIAGEEEGKTLDLLLAHPVSRTRVVLEKFLALLVATVILGVIFWLVLWSSAVAVNMDIAASNLAVAMLGAVNLGLLFGALALALGAATGNRSLSLGITATIGVAAYLLNSLGANVEALETVRKLSPFYLYIGAQPLENGLSFGHTAALLGATLVLLLVALAAFNRRDVAV